MSRSTVVLAIFVALGAGTTSVGAGTVSVSVKDGRVTIVADNATPREILAEWARVGHVRIVNGERVPGQPLTLRLDGVTERRALDIVLRGAAGYMLASRETPGRGSTYFDRIVILPTSNTAAVAAAPAQAAVATRRAAPTDPAPASAPADSGMMGFSAAPADASSDETDPDPANLMPQAPVMNPYGPPAQNPYGQPGQVPNAPGVNPYAAGANPYEQGQAEAVEMQQAPALFPGSPSAPVGVVPTAPAGSSAIPAAGAAGASRPGEVVQPAAPPTQYLNPYNIGARPAPEQPPAPNRPGSSTTTTPRPPRQ